MEQLPFFLLLLKKNVLLCSIIVNGSFAQVNLSGIESFEYSKSAIDFLNFSLGEKEQFPKVTVVTGEEDISIKFYTTNAEYFERPEKYFQRSSTAYVRQPLKIFGKTTQSEDKYLGDFEMHLGPAVPPASVYVTRSGPYGYTVYIAFYKFNLNTLGNQ